MRKFEEIKKIVEKEAKIRTYSLSKYKDWNQDILNACCGFILDLGCGDGAYTREMLNNKQKVISADISKIRLIRVQKYNSLVVNCSATQLPFKDNIFDSVLFLEVIEHLPIIYEQHKALAQIKGILKNKGKLILSTPNKSVYQLVKKIWYYLSRQQPDPTHFAELNYKELIRIVSQHFKIIYQRGKFGFIKNKTFQRCLGRFPAICYDVLFVCEKD